MIQLLADAFTFLTPVGNILTKAKCITSGGRGRRLTCWGMWFTLIRGSSGPPTTGHTKAGIAAELSCKTNAGILSVFLVKTGSPLLGPSLHRRV